MITESELYWILKLDDIRTFFVGCTVFFFIAAALLPILTLVHYAAPVCTERTWRSGRFTRLVVYIAPLVSMLMIALLPSTKQMAAIKAIPAIVNSDAAKDITSDTEELYKLGIKALKEKLTDINSNKEK